MKFFLISIFIILILKIYICDEVKGHKFVIANISTKYPEEGEQNYFYDHYIDNYLFLKIKLGSDEQNIEMKFELNNYETYIVKEDFVNKTEFTPFYTNTSTTFKTLKRFYSQKSEFTKAMNAKKKYPFIYNSINSLTAQKREENEDNISVDEYISFFDDELSDSKTKEGQKKLFSVFCDDNPNSFSWTKFALTARELGDNEMANKLLKLIEQSKVYIKDINFKEFASILNEDYKKEMRNRDDSEDYGKKESYSVR